MKTTSDIEVPPGMLKTYMTARGFSSNHVADPTIIRPLAAALLYHSENPIVPSEEELKLLVLECAQGASVNSYKGWSWMIVEWQHRMFLKKPDPLPDEVKKLLWTINGDNEDHEHNSAVIAAYKLGKEGK